MYNIFKAVAARYATTLVCFDSPISVAEDIKSLKELCNEVFTIPMPVQPERTFLHKIRDLFRKEPIGLCPWWSDEMSSALTKLVKSHSFDLVHIDHLLLCQYRSALSNLPQVLTHHNIESQLQARLLASSSRKDSLQRLAAKLEYNRWVHYEIKASRLANALITVSELDADYFRRQQVQKPIFVVPNGVDTQLFKPSIAEPAQKRLLFTGQMDYPPNVDAMLWFCQEIYPQVRKRHPDAELFIVGRDPTPEIQALKTIPGVTITGQVEDVRPYYHNASLFVVPLRIGGGTRLKIPEAMAMGKAIISTPIGCEGLDLTPGKDLLVASQTDDFIDSIHKLLENHQLRDALANQARITAEQKHDWANFGGILEQAYQCAIEMHKRTERNSS